MSPTHISSRPFQTASVTRLETSRRHALHAYQGLCPWDARQERLLYAAFEESADRLQIVVRDLAAGTERTVAESTHGDFHTGAYQQWILQGRGVVFRSVEDGCLGSRMVPAGPDASLHSNFYPGIRVRTTSSDGARGYGHLKQDGVDGAAIIDFQSGEIRLVFTALDASRHLPSDLQEDCNFAISHFVPNPRETMAFFKLSKPEPHRKRAGGMDDWGAFFVYDFRTAEFRCLGQRISGHPQWMPAGTRIVNIMQPLDGSDNRRLVTQNALSGTVERVVDFLIEGAGHPAVSPDGRYLATDAYTADGQCSPVYLVDLFTGQMGEIARFDHFIKTSRVYEPRTIFRSNLHPVWSPDGSRLLVNANEMGTRLGLYLLENFLGDQSGTVVSDIRREA